VGCRGRARCVSLATPREELGDLRFLWPARTALAEDEIGVDPPLLRVLGEDGAAAARAAHLPEAAHDAHLAAARVVLDRLARVVDGLARAHSPAVAAAPVTADLRVVDDLVVGHGGCASARGASRQQGMRRG